MRKFGSEILQYPRGVSVDNKGRIIIVECKIMRIIIFDQVDDFVWIFLNNSCWIFFTKYVVHACLVSSGFLPKILFQGSLKKGKKACQGGLGDPEYKKMLWPVVSVLMEDSQ